MLRVSLALFAAFAVLATWGLLRDHHERKLELVGGRTTISFLPSVLDSLHLKVVANQSAEPDTATSEASSGFQIAASNLRFTLIDGHLGRFNGGTFSHKGGFSISSGNKKVDAEQFLIAASNTLADGLQLVTDTNKEAFVAFDLVHPRSIYQPAEKQMAIVSMDMVMSLRCAQELGRPELSGQLIGSLSVYGDSEVIDGGGEVVIPHGDGGHSMLTGLDLAISDMGSLTALGRVGTYPNGRNGLSMYTTSCNVGTIQVPWYAPMQIAHPAIAMNLYRVLNGRFEQIGWSWMKHGFYATNSNGCGSCQGSGTGSLLGIGCSDTYGTGNNGDRYYLGGRDEINPLTGVWTCTNSWFSNYQNDCVRRNTGTGLDAVAHRLDVADSDLGNQGATYFYEANYICADDINRYNNIASRQATMTWNGSQWSISTVDGGEVQGPAINRWGEKRSTAQPQTDGDVIVAVQTTNLGGGMWHYEYAVYNHTLDRQIREFSVPMPDGMTVQNIGFHDIDIDPSNEWTAAVGNNSVTWSTGVYGSSTANPLKFASVFNFRFDANVLPAESSARLGMFKPGTGDNLYASTKAPVLLQPLDGFDLVNATLVSGNLQSLFHSDDDRLALQGTPQGSVSGVGIIGYTTAPNASPASLVVGVESSDWLPLASGAYQSIRVWNWSSNAWETLDTRPSGSTDSIALVTVTTNPARFVNPNTLQVQVQVLHFGNSLRASAALRPTFDQVGVQFN